MLHSSATASCASGLTRSRVTAVVGSHALMNLVDEARSASKMQERRMALAACRHRSHVPDAARPSLRLSSGDSSCRVFSPDRHQRQRYSALHRASRDLAAAYLAEVCISGSSNGRIEIRDDHAVLFPIDRIRHVIANRPRQGPGNAAPCTRSQVFGRLVPGTRGLAAPCRYSRIWRSPAVSITGPISLRMTHAQQVGRIAASRWRIRPPREVPMKIACATSERRAGRRSRPPPPPAS